VRAQAKGVDIAKVTTKALNALTLQNERLLLRTAEEKKRAEELERKNAELLQKMEHAMAVAEACAWNGPSRARFTRAGIGSATPVWG
jgi:hypothetical protein